MKKLLTIWTLFVLTITLLQGQTQTISGQVIDQETKEPLPYATVGFPNNALGTVTNGEGIFELQVPEEYKSYSIKVSYLGYESVLIRAADFTSNMTVSMAPSVIQLADLVVRPLAPEDYIKRSVKKFPENYATKPFNSTAYYREKFTENGNFLGMSEGYFKSYITNYQDTLKNQYQLVLHRKADNIHEVEFLKNKRDKKAKKEAKKAAKSGAEVKKDSIENDVDAGVLIANFGGPEEVLNGDVVRDLDDFLDSTLFKKYRYQFEQDLIYDGKKVMVISFKSKGTYEHIRQKGIIYIDQSSDAIIAIDFSGEVVIPLVAQPILFALGFSFKDMYVTKKLRYQQIDGIWFPNTIQWDFTAELTKRYMFKSNETSRFAGEQIYNIDKIELNEVEEIPSDKQFNNSEEIEDQVYPIDGVTWSKINTLKIEELNN